MLTKSPLNTVSASGEIACWYRLIFSDPGSPETDAERILRTSRAIVHASYRYFVSPMFHRRSNRGCSTDCNQSSKMKALCIHLLHAPCSLCIFRHFDFSFFGNPVYLLFHTRNLDCRRAVAVPELERMKRFPLDRAISIGSTNLLMKDIFLEESGKNG
jgi:hypothetical protein